MSSSSSSERSSSSGDESSGREREVKRRKINELVDKRVKKISGPAFKFPSNKEQFHFNNEVLQELGAAKSKAKGRVRHKVKKAMKKLKHRNKLIKIADKSKGGWKTVAEYEGDEVAKNPKDRKKIRQAEKLALEKLADEKKNKSAGTSQQSREQGSSSRNGRNGQSRNNTDQQYRNAPQGERYRSSVTCFRCGRQGHISRECWQYKRQENYGRNDGY